MNNPMVYEEGLALSGRTTNESFPASRRTSRRNSTRNTLGDLEAGTTEKPDNANEDPAQGTPDANKVVDEFAVDWEENDPEDPQNWSKIWQWGIVAFLSWITLLTPLASSIFAPGIPDVMAEFNSDNNMLATFMVSVFVLGFAFGPLLIAPLSELYGRTPIYHTCNVLFVLFTVGCAMSTSLDMLITFRFFAGFAGVSAVTCGAGSITDMLPVSVRGRAISYWSMGPLLGPTIGPVIAGFVIEALGWRWAFWIVVIAAGASTVAAPFILKETYAPVLLEKRAAKLRKTTGNDKYYSVMSQDPGRQLTPKQKMIVSLVRPMRMLALQPVVTIMAIYTAVQYGVTYILFTTFTFVYKQQYGFSAIGAGLSFISCGVGMFMGLTIVANFSDLILRRAKNPSPETRLDWRLSVPGVTLIPAGLLIYGWAAYYQTHWMGPMMGSGIMSVGSIIINMCTQTFLVDSFPLHAASVSAANTVLRSVMGAILPLCGLGLYDGLGLGWGNTLLAGLSLILAPVPVAMGFYGARIKALPISKRFQG